MVDTSRESPELEALVELMFLIARVDGDFSPSERREFLETVGSLSEGRLDSTELLSLVERLENALVQEGLEARLRAAASRLPDELSRRLALGLCTQVALSDGVIDEAERRLLDHLAELLDISPDDEEEIAHSVRLTHPES